MLRWTSSLHPRASDGKFKGKGGGGRDSRPLSIVGQGRATRFNRLPRRAEMIGIIGRRAAGGALAGAAVGGVPGAQFGGSIAATNAALKVVVLTRRTKANLR